VIDMRTSLAAASGGGVGALGALAAVHAAHSAAQAVAFGAAAVSVGGISLAAALWLESARPARDRWTGALVVFVLFVAAGLMLAGGHARG
jgi:hypothetical protein